MGLIYDTTFLTAVALVLFLGILYYAGVHKTLGGMLDARAQRIRDELDEARRLREEAQALFAEFERRNRDVAAQAEDIVTHARKAAETAAEKAKADLANAIERKLRAADEQIAMAEASAVREVRDRAVEVAVAAAADVIRSRMTEAQSAALIDSAIETTGNRLN